MQFAVYGETIRFDSREVLNQYINVKAEEIAVHESVQSSETVTK
jgi:hypothetical protein